MLPTQTRARPSAGGAVGAARVVRRMLVVALLGTGLGATPGARAAGPAVDQVVAAWSTARTWLDGYATPRDQDQDAAVVVDGAFGYSVVLRAGGEIVGRGASAPADGLSLRRALAQAMGEAWGNGMRSLAESLGDRAVGRRMTLELEVVGDPSPLLGRSFAEAASRIRPGIDGQALRRGERWALGYSGRLLASNSARNPAAVFAALATELGLPAKDLTELRGGDDVALYRLEGVRLVQLKPGAAPTVLIRNDELVPESAATRESMARLAAAVGYRLVRTVQRQAGGGNAATEETTIRGAVEARAAELPPSDPGEAGLLRGDYRPAGGDYRPALAPPADQALGALALMRLAQSDAATHLTEAPGLAGECRVVALRVLDALATNAFPALSQGNEEPLADRRAAAAAALAVVALPVDDRAPWLRALLEWTVTALAAPAAALPGGAAHPAPDDPAPAALPARSPNSLALEAAALAGALRDGEAPVERSAVVAAIDAAWAAAPGGRAAALLPWIAWAERDLHAFDQRAAGRPGHADPRPIEPLLTLRDVLLSTQVRDGAPFTADTPDPLGWGPDLRGGFQMLGASGDAVPPTSQSLRPAAGLAAMLVDRRLTPDVVVAPLLARQRAAGRFMLQLAVRPPVDGLFSRPQAVVNGLRNATWDCDQPVAAQAMGILAALETVRAFERAEELARGQARGVPEPPGAAGTAPPPRPGER